MAPVNDRFHSRKSSSKPLKHPFFMAPSERATQRLSHHIQESNALNKAIQINLISEDDDDKEEEQDNPKTLRLLETNEFFQKRIKTTTANYFKHSINLKKVSSSELPPYPLEFQLPKTLNSHFEAKSCSPLIIKAIDPILISLNQSISISNHEFIPLAGLIKESHSEIKAEGLKRLNNIICDRSIGISDNLHTINSIINEIEVSLSHDQPILWGFTGPPGVGKTKLVETISEALDLRLITIDSTQSPRNSKTFETLQTTLSHNTPRSFSQFFSAPEKQQGKKKHKVAVLFDEVEIAFESDRGYWSALSSFLQSSIGKTVPIFITSNVRIDSLESIIKLPDHFRFHCIAEGDHRKLSNNSDFISRLHRIDTSIEYEQLALITGYHLKSDYVINEEVGKVDSVALIEEALRWNGLLENVHISSSSKEIDAFSYSESASLADILLSIKERSVKMNLDYSENLHSEFFAYETNTNDIPIISNSLLYSNIPEIYSNIPETSFIARELLERTIHPFINFEQNIVRKVKVKGSDSKYWKDFSKRLALRFFNYTKSLQTWNFELSNHVVSIEIETFSKNRGRRKRAHYRYIGEDLLNEILNLNHDDINK